MPLTDAQTDEAVARYQSGDSIDAIAKDFGEHANAVRHKLGKRGALSRENHVTLDTLSERPTDEELGIGEDDEAPDPLASLLNDPRVAQMIEAAVAARVSQIATSAANPSGDFDTLAKTLARMIEVNQMQQPGYTKPLPVEEIERRLAGKVEMDALLRQYERDGKTPLYTVGAGGFFECANAQEFPPGMQVRTFLHPPEDFQADNEWAENVMAAQRQWLGVPTPHIGDQVEAAMRERNLPPLITGSLQTERRGPVEMVTPAPASQQRTRRVMGSITPERHNTSMADRAGAPQGPSFVSSEAV